MSQKYTQNIQDKTYLGQPLIFWKTHDTTYKTAFFSYD